jgi:hypothetical protein
MKNFFISYNKADKEWAQWLDWLLRSRGYSTFTQFGDIPWGSNFVARMDEGLKEAERLIMVLSPDFLSSGFTESEWTVAFAKDPDGKKGLLLPVRVRECELTGLLAPRVYLDLWELDEVGATNALANGLTKLTPPPAGAGEIASGSLPPFPYLQYDFLIEYCDSEADRVEPLASALESQQKKVWRDSWKLADGTLVRRKNRPASLRFGCQVVCAGDASPDGWVRAEIENALNQQRSAPSLKFVPVVFGGSLAALKQAYSDILFWADGSNAIRLLTAAATETKLSPQNPVAEKVDQIVVYLENLQRIKPFLDPAIAQQAQLDAIAELRKATYGR